MRLNQKIIKIIEFLALLTVIPVFLVMVMRLTAWGAGADWTPEVAWGAAVASALLSMAIGGIVAGELWPKS